MKRQSMVYSPHPFLRTACAILRCLPYARRVRRHPIGSCYARRFPGGRGSRLLLATPLRTRTRSASAYRATGLAYRNEALLSFPRLRRIAGKRADCARELLLLSLLRLRLRVALGFFLRPNDVVGVRPLPFVEQHLVEVPAMNRVAHDVGVLHSDSGEGNHSVPLGGLVVGVADP